MAVRSRCQQQRLAWHLTRQHEAYVADLMGAEQIWVSEGLAKKFFGKIILFECNREGGYIYLPGIPFVRGGSLFCSSPEPPCLLFPQYQALHPERHIPTPP